MKIVDWYRSLDRIFVRRPQLAGGFAEGDHAHLRHRVSDVETSSQDRPFIKAPSGAGPMDRDASNRPGRAWGDGDLLGTVMQDVRYGFRVLRRSPGFAIVAAITLALAIGANAVVFAVIDALVLRPLRVPQAETLYGTQYGDDSGFQSYPNYLDLRDRNHSFQDVAAFSFVFAGLDTGSNSVPATGFETTENYFDVLGVKPYLGRFFHGADNRGPNSAPYIVLSYAYWHRRFQDDPNVLGRVVQLNKHPFTIIGVAPQGFVGTLLFVSPDFFMPIVNQEQVSGESILNARANTHAIFETFGHLKPGVTLAQANADVNAIGNYLQSTYPHDVRHKSVTLGHPGLASFGSSAHAFVAGLMLLSALILLAACADLGILFAAHASDRSRADGIRLALGASRLRLIRQLLTEAMLISLAGGVLGVVGSVMLLFRLSKWQPFPGTPVHLPVTVDVRIYLVALVLALVSGFLFGIVPMGQVMRANPYQIVKAGSGDVLGRRITLRDVLLVVQISICAMLITSSLTAVRGLTRSLHANFGFDPRNTMLFSNNLTIAGYGKADVLPVQKRLIEGMATIQGVDQVGLVNEYPPLVYASAHKTNIYKDTTTDLTPSNATATPYRYMVSPGYFSAAGTRELSGRDFLWTDDKNAPLVAVTNAEFARRMFGTPANAVGKYFKNQDGHLVQIVGIVEDGKYLSLTEDQRPAVFFSALQSPSSGSYLILRSRRDPQELAAAIRKELRAIDPGMPAEVDTWTSLLGVVLFPSRMAALVLGVLGIMGATLSITGIFGMAAYSVNKRLKELGIRMALGAQRSQILSVSLGRALKLLTVGSIAGVVLGVLASRVLSAIVYEATSHDPLVLAAVVVAMALLGLVATWLPAQRALGVNPLRLLRED